MGQEQRKRILILDDDRFAVEPLARILRRKGLEVDVTDRPQSCLERARKKRYDLFIVDINLGPNPPADLQDGLAVTQALRREKAAVNVPIIGITGHEPERREEALRLGMVKFLLKPLKPDEDVPTILGLLESRSQAQEAIAKWLVETAGPGWNVLELMISDGYARLRSSLVAGEGPLTLQGHDVSLALRFLHQGHFDKELFEEVGTRLYEGLFPPQVNVGLQQCRLLAQLAQQPVRLLIRIEDRLWAHLPWELCRYTGGTHGGHWLGGDPYLTCIRGCSPSGPMRPDESLEPPLRILVIASSPIAAPRIQLVEELRELHEALEPLERARPGHDIQWLVLGPSDLAGIVRTEEPVREASTGNVRDALARFRPQIVHFIGHGRVGEAVLEDRGQMSEWSDFFLQFDFVGKGVRLLVLNCCLSGHPGDGSGGLALAGLTAGVTAVIGHLYRVNDFAARRFSKLLYERLARGDALDVAFQSARHNVWSDELRESRTFLPLLFVRDQILRLNVAAFGV